jgi:hypothetical protein
MPFTLQELENIANAAIDFHMERGNVKSQTLQDKPLLAAMKRNQITVPGGKEFLTRRVKGIYTTGIQGFEHDDTVTYANPGNIRTATYPWKLIHSGITFSWHEMLKDGITISNSTNGTGESSKSEREMTALANLLQDKLEDMTEGTERGMNLMFWRDGAQDPKQVPGIRSFILDNPTSATVVAGIDQSANTWWRNRAVLGMNTATDQIVVTTLQKEMRQLRRFGSPRHLALAGSDFIERFETELRAKGTYTDSGWASRGRIDASVADVAFKGVNIDYDPTLDDLGLAKYCFFIDTRAIRPAIVAGEDGKRHSPARPEDKYVFYRAMTWVGGLVCDQRNTSGVYSIA